MIISTDYADYADSEMRTADLLDRLNASDSTPVDCGSAAL
jgi:hypothetical protein